MLEVKIEENARVAQKKTCEDNLSSNLRLPAKKVVPAVVGAFENKAV